MTEEQKQKLRDLLVEGKYMTPGGDNACIDIEPLYELIDKVMAEPKPEHSKIVETYIVGKNPKWKVGDTLAYYDLTTDREGEHPLGKIASIEYDEYLEDWIYVFDNNSSDLEETLLDIDAYIIKTK